MRVCKHAPYVVASQVCVTTERCNFWMQQQSRMQPSTPPRFTGLVTPQTSCPGKGKASPPSALAGTFPRRRVLEDLASRARTPRPTSNPRLPPPPPPPPPEAVLPSTTALRPSVAPANLQTALSGRATGAGREREGAGARPGRGKRGRRGAIERGRSRKRRFKTSPRGRGRVVFCLAAPAGKGTMFFLLLRGALSVLVGLSRYRAQNLNVPEVAGYFSTCSSITI